MRIHQLAQLYQNPALKAKIYTNLSFAQAIKTHNTSKYNYSTQPAEAQSLFIIHDYVYRGENRPPGSIKADGGFWTQGLDGSIGNHIQGNGTSSTYLSTSWSQSVASKFVKFSGYVYKIRPKGIYVDLPDTEAENSPCLPIGDDQDYKHWRLKEQEAAIVDGVDYEDIEGWQKAYLFGWHSEKFEPNPYFNSKKASLMIKILSANQHESDVIQGHKRHNGQIGEHERFLNLDEARHLEQYFQQEVATSRTFRANIQENGTFALKTVPQHYSTYAELQSVFNINGNEKDHTQVYFSQDELNKVFNKNQNYLKNDHTNSIGAAASYSFWGNNTGRTYKPAVCEAEAEEANDNSLNNQPSG